MMIFLCKSDKYPFTGQGKINICKLAFDPNDSVKVTKHTLTLKIDDVLVNLLMMIPAHVSSRSSFEIL